MSSLANFIVKFSSARFGVIYALYYIFLEFDDGVCFINGRNSIAGVMLSHTLLLAASWRAARPIVCIKEVSLRKKPDISASKIAN